VTGDVAGGATVIPSARANLGMSQASMKSRTKPRRSRRRPGNTYPASELRPGTAAGADVGAGDGAEALAGGVATEEGSLAGTT